MWPRVAVDHVGAYATIAIDRAVYSDAAIFKSAYWFTDRYYLFLDNLPDGRIAVELRAKSSVSDEELERAGAEFCNSLIDFRLRDIVQRETGSIREALVTKAFLEGVAR